MNALAEAVVEAAAFLELSPDEVVDADSSVVGLEAIAAALDRSSAEERHALLRYCQKQAAICSDPRRRAFYESFPEDFGVLGD